MSAVHSTPTGDSTSAGPARVRTNAANWAIRIAWAVVTILAVAYAIFGVTWAVGGEDAVSDTFVGYLAGFALVGGILASLVAFAIAMIARAKHQRPALLWLPIALFPALVLLVILVEALWIE